MISAAALPGGFEMVADIPTMPREGSA